ncbi:hydrogenase HycP [Pseudonocardia zijingensis]|uniref:Hydrogenase HycP n=1 Tax=Pseudonocardia zijingensis TaxID=153376 RepID=A0ABP3YQ76_9PSEU
MHGIEMLNIAAGALLLTAVLVLWRREITMIVRIFALQGVALAALVAVLAWDEGSAELAVVAAGLLVLRGVVLPWLLRRALTGAAPGQRESRPALNVAASLLAAAALTLLALAVSAPLVALSPAPATRAIPIAIAVVLIGFLVLVTRRHAVSQLVGFLLMDNGITAAGFLSSAGIGLLVEVGVALDLLLVVLVLQVLTGRMRETFGDTDLDELRELHD